MTTFALKCSAAKTTSAWQLALDKLPFDLDLTVAPRLTTIENNRVVSVKAKRLREIRDRASYQYTKAEWQAAIKSRMDFLATLERQHGPRFRRIPLVNSSRLLLHLGRSSVLENVGIYCDRTTGLPVIPGCAVKGVVSTWACWEGNGDAIYPNAANGQVQLQTDRGQFQNFAKAILGDNSPDGSESAGCVVFVGAIPASLPVIGMDIVTPHTDAQGHDKSPVPNPFLSIESGTVWHFAFFMHPSVATDNISEFLSATEGWLKDALAQSGMGAKIASGYGRFIEPKDWEKSRLTEQELQNHDRNQVLVDEMRKGTIGDYNEENFNTQVIQLLKQPNRYTALQLEIRRIHDNPANAPWIEKITDALNGGPMKDYRKRLKDKEWFPNEWLPQ